MMNRSPEYKVSKGLINVEKYFNLYIFYPSSGEKNLISSRNLFNSKVI